MREPLGWLGPHCHAWRAKVKVSASSFHLGRSCRQLAQRNDGCTYSSMQNQHTRPAVSAPVCVLTLAKSRCSAGSRRTLAINHWPATFAHPKSVVRSSLCFGVFAFRTSAARSDIWRTQSAPSRAASRRADTSGQLCGGGSLRAANHRRRQRSTSCSAPP